MSPVIKDELVLYNERMVPKRGFRAFIYSDDGQIKLVSGWDVFQAYVSSDNWFASREEIPVKKPIKKRLSKENIPEENALIAESGE